MAAVMMWQTVAQELEVATVLLEEASRQHRGCQMDSLIFKSAEHVVEAGRSMAKQGLVPAASSNTVLGVGLYKVFTTISGFQWDTIVH